MKETTMGKAGDWESDDSLIEQGKRSARAANGCPSVVIADATVAGEEVRAYFCCSESPREKHTVHRALNGDEWWRESTRDGRWKHEGPELTNINMNGASIDA